MQSNFSQSGEKIDFCKWRQNTTKNNSNNKTFRFCCFITLEINLNLMVLMANNLIQRKNKKSTI